MHRAQQITILINLMQNIYLNCRARKVNKMCRRLIYDLCYGGENNDRRQLALC